MGVGLVAEMFDSLRTELANIINSALKSVTMDFSECRSCCEYLLEPVPCEEKSPNGDDEELIKIQG